MGHFFVSVGGLYVCLAVEAVARMLGIAIR